MAATCGHTNDYLKAQPLEALWFGAQSSSGGGGGWGGVSGSPERFFLAAVALAIWKDGSCSGTGWKMSWLHSAGKSHCCKIPGLTWIPWDRTKQIYLLGRQILMDLTDQFTFYNTYKSTLSFVPSFSTWSLRISASRWKTNLSEISFFLVTGIIPCFLQLFWEWDTAEASVGLHSLPLSRKENSRAFQMQHRSANAMPLLTRELQPAKHDSPNFSVSSHGLRAPSAKSRIGSL